ncbi:hypothetical protein [Nocardioides aequoreus]|nr:hypothetical protein [Nocardioides aequoreus]
MKSPEQEEPIVAPRGVRDLTTMRDFLERDDDVTWVGPSLLQGALECA